MKIKFVLILMLLDVIFAQWLYYPVGYNDTYPDDYCQSTTEVCWYVPEYPHRKKGHSAIIYTTYSTDDMNNLCPGDYCGPYCDSQDSSCYVDNVAPTDGTAGGRGDLPTPGGLSTGSNNSAATCPESCCETANENCFRSLNNNGEHIYPDEEVMIIFGGSTYRDKYYNGELLFDNCEEEALDDKPDSRKNCGEELLNEIWIYYITRNVMTYVKPDYNRQTYSSWTAPSPRYGHTAVYIEIEIIETDSNQQVKRKYMYVYGGFSYDCATACEDLWRYEIAWAPQRWYPEPNSGGAWWNRGNHWTLVKEDSTNSPGRRWKHTMISDYNNETIYLFGGIKSNLDSTNDYMNDMWRYYTLSDKWEEVIGLGINTITRRINLWDGTFIDRQVLDDCANNTECYYLKDGDDPLYRPSTTNETIRMPSERAGHSMNLIGNPPYFILVYGGFTRVTETKESTNTDITVRTDLNDLWVFSLYSNKWQQVAVNSDDNPSIREDSKMITVNLERLAIMYGGFYADQIYSEMWYFNLFSNMWQKVNQQVDDTVSNSRLPMGLQGHSFVYSDSGIVLYGGQYWNEADLTLTDANFERRSEYETKCQDILDAHGLTINDIGTAAFEAKFAETGDSCFNETEPFLTLERSVQYNYDVYVFPVNNCQNNCSDRGYCSFGRCTCMGSYYGSQCEYSKCPNSLCFVDIDTIDAQECFHCSMHGTCQDGTCVCDQGYIGDDCSKKDCMNTCSGDTCIEASPISQCYCNQTEHRGADDCSYTFCLNNCGNYGTCVNGVCECVDPYIGEDCTVFKYDVSVPS